MGFNCLHPITFGEEQKIAVTPLLFEAAAGKAVVRIYGSYWSSCEDAVRLLEVQTVSVGSEALAQGWQACKLPRCTPALRVIGKQSYEQRLLSDTPVVTD